MLKLFLTQRSEIEWLFKSIILPGNPLVVPQLSWAGISCRLYLTVPYLDAVEKGGLVVLKRL